MYREIEASGSIPLYQLKITLRGSKPPIWRRVVVRADMKLDRLHRVLQIAIGWTNSHLHLFHAGRKVYGSPDREFDGLGQQILDDRRWALADIARGAGQKFVYEYDLGDSWEHRVVLEKVLPPDSAFKHPQCLAGANACPPEDCGGIIGYYGFLEAMADPKHEQHQDMLNWIGGSWDSARFNLSATNAQLNRLKA